MNYVCDLCGGIIYERKGELSKRLGIDRQQCEVVGCVKCGLHSLYPVPNSEQLITVYNNYAKKGDRIRVEKRRVREIYPWKIEKIKKYAPGHRVLDIGAGLGGFVYTAKNSGLEVTGLEMEKSQIALGRSVFGVNLVCGSIEEFLNRKVEPYDAIHMHHVLEHLKSPMTALKNIRKALNRHGIIVMEVPNEFFVLKKELLIKMRLEVPPRPFIPYHHLHFFSPHTFKEITKAAGYKIVKFREIKNGANILKRIYTRFASLFGIGSSSKMEIIGRKM